MTSLMQRRFRGRRFVFTINDFTEEDEQRIRDLEHNPQVTALIAEEEHLDEGTPHIQGYIAFNHTITGKVTLHQFLGTRAWFDVAKGTQEENFAYCSKEDQVIVKKEKVTIKTLKERAKDEESRLMIREMRELDEDEFEEKYPHFYRLHKQQYREFHYEAEVKAQESYNGNLKAKNLWIWGPPGTGKSVGARKGLMMYEVFSKAYNKWWNGFDATVHKRVIIDDWPSLLNGGNILVQHLKIWADRYPFTAETKGGHLAIEPSYQLVITSNYPIDQCFQNQEDIEAIKRRFTELEYDSFNPEKLDPYTDLVI